MKNKKIAKLFLYLILISFIFSYFIEKSGYYEYNLQTKRNLTEKEIKKFEQDVREGKKVDINTYLKDSRVDYSNKLTKTTSNFSIKLNKYINETISNTFNIFSRLIK